MNLLLPLCDTHTEFRETQVRMDPCRGRAKASEHTGGFMIVQDKKRKERVVKNRLLNGNVSGGQQWPAKQQKALFTVGRHECYLCFMVVTFF